MPDDNDASEKENKPPPTKRGRKKKQSGGSNAKELSSKSRPRAARTTWSTKESEVLVGELLVQKSLGNQSDTGWKTITWRSCSEKLKAELGVEKNPDMCKQRWKTLKGNYLVVKILHNKSGAGVCWNGEKHIMEAPDDAWEDWIASDERVEAWRNKPFPLYDEIGDLVDGTHAKGELALSVSETQRSDIMESSQGPDSLKTDTQQTASKHQRSSSPDVDDVDDVPPAPKRVKSRPSGPSAVLGVADALRELAVSFRETEDDTNEHLRREKAARLISKDVALSPTTRHSFLCHIRKDLDAADVYMGIEDEDDRAHYVHATLVDSAPPP